MIREAVMAHLDGSGDAGVRISRSGDKAAGNWPPVHTCATISRDESLSDRFDLKCLVSWKEEL